MERRTISASSTRYYKSLWPLFVVAPLWLVFAYGLDILRNTMALVLTAYFLIVMNPIVTVWLALNIKNADMDGDYLYVSDRGNEVRIPLEEVADVTEMRWLPPHWVTVHLRNPSELGEKIVFTQSWRWGAWFGTESELVTKLKQLARSKQPTGFIPPRPEKRLFDDQ